MFYLYDDLNFEFSGTSEVKTEYSTEVSPFDETGLKVTGNYFNPEKKVWYNKSQPVDTTQQMISLLAQQTVQLTNQNKMLQQEIATFAKQVVENKGGN